MGEALNELAALLHDGQIGGEVGVEDVVKAQPAQRRHHAAGGGLLGGKVEALRPGRPYRRGHLDNGGDLRIGQGPEDAVGIVPDGQGAGGAVGDALSAEHAVRVHQVPVVAHIHGGAGAGARHVPDIHALDLVADLDAAHTLDALAGLPDNGRPQIHPGALRLHLVGLKVDVQVMRQTLELTVAAADADGAVAVVLAEKQAQVGFPRLPDPGGVGADRHALQYLRVAGGDQAVGALHLHDAHAAGGDFVDILQEAQVGNGDAGLLRRLQNGGAGGDGQLPAVNFKVYHFSTLPPLKMP